MKHEWDDGRFGFVCCRVCMLVRNDKNKDGDCKGPAKLTLRCDP
jgi:hypothetical protein